MLHYVALQAEKANPDLLTLPEDLSVLEEASKTSVEQLSLEVTQLDKQIKKIANQMNAPNTQADVKNQMSEFLGYAYKEVTVMKERMDQLRYNPRLFGGLKGSFGVIRGHSRSL